MRKIFVVMILLAAMIAGGCTTSKFGIVSTDDSKIEISVENSDKDSKTGNIKIPDGAAVQVDAKISAGTLIISGGGKEYEINQSGEYSLDLPPGNHELFFNTKNNLTGEIVLRVMPKV